MSNASAPVYLVKGDDPGLVAEALQKLVDALVGEGDPSLMVEVLSAAEVDASAVVDTCQTPPFFAEKRVVLLREIGNYKADHAVTIASYLADPLPTTTLVCVAGGGQTSPKVLDAVKKHGHVIDTTMPTGGKARAGWLNEKLASAPVKVLPAARALLTEHLGEDLGRLGGLFEALVAAYGEGAEISNDELAPFLGEFGTIAPWDFTDAIDRAETGLALGHLHRMLNAGERHPLVIMATLHRHFGAMLRLDGSGVMSDSEAASLLKMSPYPAKKVLAQTRRLGRRNILRAVELLAAADLDLRGATGWDQGVVLEVLVARLSKLSGSRLQASRSGNR